MKIAMTLLKITVFVIVVYFVGMKLYGVGYNLFYEKSMEKGQGTEIIFEIKHGDNVKTIAENLYNAKLIDDKLAFEFRAKIYKTNFKANTYVLNTNLTIKNMLDIFDSPTSENLLKETEDNVYQLSPEGEEVETSE